MDKGLKNRLGRLEHKLDCTFNKLMELEDFFKDDYYKKLYDEAKAKKENAEWEFVDVVDRGRNRGRTKEDEYSRYWDYQDIELLEEKA